jgi:hypothetical protein
MTLPLATDTMSATRHHNQTRGEGLAEPDS